MKRKLLTIITVAFLQLVVIFVLAKIIITKGNILGKTISLEKFETESFSKEKSVLHPYLGFVNEYPSQYSEINQFGFLGPKPIFNKQENEIIIAIFGGSVARLLYQFEHDYIKRQLETYSNFLNKKITILSFALGGFKQPQQLITLNYLLALGAKFDVIINIDGFNEVVLSSAENIPNNISSFYPRLWNLYSRNSLNLPILRKIEEIEKHKSRLEEIKNLFALPFLSNFNFVYNYLASKEMSIISQEEGKLSNLLQNSEKTYQTKGPETYVFNTEEIKDNIIKVWRESSVQMNNLAKANNFLYLHFLQPNQYVLNSKNLTAEEKNLAWKEDHPYKKPVELFYPILISEGITLKKQGVLFTDLTNIFVKIKDSIYIDNCCHYNKIGNQILADYILGVINENFMLSDSKKE